MVRTPILIVAPLLAGCSGDDNAAGQVGDGVIDLAVDAIRDRLRRSLPTVPSFSPFRF